MEEINGYSITQKEFKKLSKHAENIYNTAIVVNYFCSNQPEIEELCNLTPVVKNLLKDADSMNAFFIDNENSNSI